LPLRTVIEQRSVTDKIDQERAIYPRLEEAWEALKWWLCRKPESGELLDDIHFIYKQVGNHELNIPTLVVIYTWDETVVIEYVLVKVPSYS